jgi:glutathione S-transferase
VPPSTLLLYVDSLYESPYAMSVFVALHEKSLPFEISTVDLELHANQAPEYMERSLTQRVPTLVHGGFALSESSAITEYLDEAFPGRPLYPLEPRSRARARQVQAWLRSDFMPLRDERPTEVIFREPLGTPLSASARGSAEKLYWAAESLLAEGADYLFGDWCIADFDLALMLNRLAFNGDPIPERLSAYARLQWQRPGVRLWDELSRR